MTIIKTGEAAKICGVTRETIRAWVTRGHLPNSTVMVSKTGKKQYLIDSRDVEDIAQSDETRTENKVVSMVQKIGDREKRLEKTQKHFENIINQFRQEFYHQQRHNKVDLTPVIQTNNELQASVDQMEKQISNLSQLPETLQTLIDIVTQRTIPKDMDTSVKKPNMKRSLPDDYNKFGGR